MTWTVEFTAKARKDLRRIHPVERARITGFLFERAAFHPDPRDLAKRLVGQNEELWRFRVGDFRIIVRFIDEKMEILVIEVGHRSAVYRD
jgi:mRNA interferase RelE/StbE